MVFSKPVKLFFSLCLVIFIIVHPLVISKASSVDKKYSMSYIYFGSSSTYTTCVSNTQDSLDEIAPNYFILNMDGTLALTSAVNRSFIDGMHERNIKVVPFLSNHWDRALGQAALCNRDELANQLAAAIAQYDLDGINVDLENLTPTERLDYVDFIRLLRERLPEGKIVSVSVAANPYGFNTGWQGSYDYQGLAAYSDYLVIMAYDEHYQGGTAGAVAGASFVDRSIQYALSLAPKDKLVLAIPFYGRIWKSGGGFPLGYGISNVTVDKLVEKYNGKTAFDQGSQTSYATITINPFDTKPVIGGSALTAGTYVIWYENEQAIKQKLSLVQKYDIKGIGSWSLGQESEGTWDYYTLWLNGCYWGDVQNHWARDAVFSAYTQGWMKGISATHFLPDQSLTRAQAAVILVRMLGLPISTNASESFEDANGHWAQAEIETARANHITDGIGNNLFAPDRPVTREEAAVLLDHFLSLTDQLGLQDTLEYPDVSQEIHSWSFAAITALSRYGIVLGYPDGGFHPEDILTRAQMAVIIGRLSPYIQ